MFSFKTRWIRFGILVLSIGALGVLWKPLLSTAEDPTIIAPPKFDNPKASGPLQTAVLAGGCFWGVQGVFEHVKGVKGVLSGYAGGKKSDARYDLVSSGTTDHAESVQITFDPAEVSYGELLQIFFSVAHDPTQLNRQGPDKGRQYRSAIFYADDAQKNVAQNYIAQLSNAKAFRHGIVTATDALTAFYPAEAYHQDFLIRNPSDPYIVFNDLPKIENLKRIFPSSYREKPVMVSNTPLLKR